MRKNFFLIFAACLFSAASIAQPPKLFKYQGLARDSSGNPVSNDTIALRISVHQGTPTGTVVYRETHNPITNEFGSFSINIGGGTVVTGNFATIPWGRNNYFQEVELDVSGGTNFDTMGTSQYLSVPYALTTDSARKGIAPFWVQNNSGGNDTAAVSVIAISYGGAPTIYCKNNGSGDAIFAEAGNGIYMSVDSNGFETSGPSDFFGLVWIYDSLRVTGGTELSLLNVTGDITASSLTAGQGNFYAGITTGGLTVNGQATINGGLNVTGLMGPISTSSLYAAGNSGVGGNFNVAGTLSKSAGSFKIDHPLDPVNKYLYHSFVESPDMKNIYDGTVTTDADGNASVELPAYFEALNRDFRYQLTAMGQFAQAIVSEEINNNKFSIKTDKPNIKISWQVTGIRKDAYAEKNRIIPEVEKDKDEKGKYLYPNAYLPNKN